MKIDYKTSIFENFVDLLLTLGSRSETLMITPNTLSDLVETLSQRAPDGKLSLTDFGQMLGKAANRYPYSRSYVSKLLAGTKPITPQVARAARAIMVSVAALDEKDWIDPLPSFTGGPIDKLKAAQAEGVSWQDLYATNADVRAFVDALIDFIIRG